MGMYVPKPQRGVKAGAGDVADAACLPWSGRESGIA